VHERKSVYLERCPGYERDVLQTVLEQAISFYLTPATLKGRKVLVKPNLVSVRAGQLAITHPQLIVAIASWLLAHGCKVSVGDSPAFGSCRAILGRHGVLDTLVAMGVEVVDFKEGVKKKIYGGLTLGVAREVLECDLLVNVPKIKAHGQMYVSMAMKNIFGIVMGMQKAMLHMTHGQSREHFAEILLALYEQLPQVFHIGDGVEVMHRNGPIKGSSLGLGCLAASECGIALDTALLAALELPFAMSPLWKVAHAQKRDGALIETLAFPRLSPSAFHGSGFQPPEELVSVRFNPFRYFSSTLKRIVLALSHKV
jgi:uncharacterized protein (DUF362 family)